jgi:outer membrane protein assembly factor BamB
MHISRKYLISNILSVLLLGSALQAAPIKSLKREFNNPGNILISDQFNNRVIEIDRDGSIVWQYGNGPDDVSGDSPIGVNDAERIDVDGNDQSKGRKSIRTLITATGAPAGSEPNCPSGCPDNRVLLVDKTGNIVWQYGTFGVTGSGFNELNTPVQSTWLPNGHVLITDQGNNRIIEVDRKDNSIVWQFSDGLSSPNSAQLLENGHILIADEGNNRAIEINKHGDIINQWTGDGSFNGVAFASQLPSGRILITDSNNNRAVEVNRHDDIVWQFFTNLDAGSNPNPLPSRALRIKHKNRTLIADQFNHRVLIVEHSGTVFRQFGATNLAGYDTDNVRNGGLNAPYDAKVIGDFTGLTPPFGF